MTHLDPATVEAKTKEIATANGCDRGTFTVCWAEHERGDICRCKQEAIRSLTAGREQPFDVMATFDPDFADTFERNSAEQNSAGGAGDAGSLAEFAPGGAYDAESHVRFLRDQGGGSAGYTADLIEKLYHALRAAPQWRTDMENAPKDITLRLWVGGVERHGQWNDDRYSNKPRPFWSYHGQTKTYSRANPPTHWSLIVAPPP